MAMPIAPVTDPTPHRTTAITAVFSGVVFFYTGLEAMLAPALPLIQEGIGASSASIAWIFTGLLLSSAISVPLVGRLTDVYDRAKIFHAVLGIVMVGVLVAALAPSVSVLAIGQVLQGVGAGFVPLIFAVFKATQPATRAKTSNGIVIGASSLGAVTGPLLTGPVLATMSYQWLYLLPLFGLVVFGLLALRVLPTDSSRAGGRIDWTGAALLGAALLTLLLGVTQAPSWGWTSGGFLALSATAVALFVAFAMVELRTIEPLIDLRGGGRPVLVTCAITFAIGWSTFAAFTVIPRIVLAPATTGYGLGETATLAGWLIIPGSLVGGIAAPFTSLLERAVGAKALMVMSCMPIAASTALLLISRQNVAVLVVSAILTGLGLGIGLTQAMNIVATHVPTERVASAVGLLTVARAVGGMLGAQTAGSILASDVDGTGLPTWSAFTWVFLSATAISLLALLTSTTLPRRLGT